MKLFDYHLKSATQRRHDEARSLKRTRLSWGKIHGPTSAAGGTLQGYWSQLPQREIATEVAMRNRLVTVTGHDPAYIAYDILRTRVHQTMKQNNWRTLAITSPSEGCGKSTTAANLAVSFAKRHQGRVALVDFDLRRPAIARIFGIENPPVLEDFLTGQLHVDDVFVRYEENLAVAGNSTPATYPSALIQSASTAKAISDIRVHLDPELIIFDLPPMLVADDVEAFLPDVDASILIAGAGVSTPTEIARCERQLAQSSNLLGVVMNACQHMPQTGYY